MVIGGKFLEETYSIFKEIQELPGHLFPTFVVILENETFNHDIVGSENFISPLMVTIVFKEPFHSDI